MACVNKSSKEFRNIAVKNNISDNTLELITHKYWIELGKEEGLPSDFYIQYQLGNTKYVEPIAEVRQLWKERYSSPQTYQTVEELNQAKEEAKKFFPSQAINNYQDAQGNYVMTIKLPVSKIGDNPIANSAMTDKLASNHISYWKQRYKNKEALENRVKLARNEIDAYTIIKKFNSQYHTNFGMTSYRIIDRIPKKYKNLITEENAEATLEQMAVLRNFLMDLFPYMEVHIMGEKTFANFLRDYKLNPNASCLVLGNHVIMPKNLNNADHLIEEFLHPFIEIIYNDRRELFDAMLKEAKKSFSLLDYQTNESYNNNLGFNQTVRDKELVTQALSRYFRSSLGKNKNKHKDFDYFVNKFIKFIRDLFHYPSEPLFKNTPMHHTKMIPISSLDNINTLADLADALNTEGISFDTRKGFKKGQVTYHLTENFDTEKYETEKIDEHRIAIYRKSQDITVLFEDDDINQNNEKQNPVISIKTWELYLESKGTLPVDNDHFKDIEDTNIEDWIEEYGEMLGTALYDLISNYPSIDIEKTIQKNKEERLEAIYDDREGELFPELSFFTNDNNPKVSIPQNRISGKHQYGWTQTAREEITDKLGKNTTSIDMIEAGYRTRTTRSATEVQKYNLSVGDVFEQYGKSSDGSTKRVLTRVTAIYGKDDPRYLGNWSKEGWTDEGIDDIKRLKDGAQVIEFEVLNNNSTTPTSSLQENETEPVASARDKQTQKELEEFDRLTELFNNLIDSDEISNSEVRHTATLIVNAISDAITEYLQNPELAFLHFELLKYIVKPEFFKTATRREIVETIGINHLLERAKLLFSPENAEYDDIETSMLAALITDNWDAMVMLAADVFTLNEDFGIVKVSSEYKTTEKQAIQYDDLGNPVDEPTIAETEGNLQEHWQLDSYTIDVLNSMSELMKRALNQCYLLDKDGNRVISKWGIAERIDTRKAVNSILRWTQGSLSLQDMIDKLSEQNKGNNTWLFQLLTRLQNKEESTFQSLFYGTFQKPFQSFSVIKLENGKYKAIPINKNSALTDAIQTITALYNIGTHPLFTSKGINRQLLGKREEQDITGDMTLWKALVTLEIAENYIKRGNELAEDLINEIVQAITRASAILGFPISSDVISSIATNSNIVAMKKALRFIVSSLETADRSSKTEYDPFKFKGENNILNSLKNFLQPITEVLEDETANSFYDNGKMYQNYVTPSFLTLLFHKFQQTGQKFEDFILKEYGNTEWFKTDKTDIRKGWRNTWLRMLATDPKARSVFEHKVTLSFNKHSYMRQMTSEELILSVITEYFSTANDKESLVPAWFRVPILSNKPSLDFIKFYSYRGDNYKEEIIKGMHEIFELEISRIQTTLMRTEPISGHTVEEIENFDKNGKLFCFLPYLNAYLKGGKISELGLTSNDVHFAELLQRKIEGKEESVLSAEEETELASLADEAMYNYTLARVESILQQYEKQGILNAARKIENISGTKLNISTKEKAIAAIKPKIENFLWNDQFAAKMALLLTIGDIAFAKDTEDLQKRLAQLHAPGIRANINVTWNGQRVSDGIYRTVILKDFKNFKSNIIANIAEIFDRKIAAASSDLDKKTWKAVKEDLVGSNGRFSHINPDDALGYSSPSSYRKKAIMLGKWSEEAETIYQNLLNNRYSLTDLKLAFLPLKPFVYGMVHKNISVNAPITTMNVPLLVKNSEYLLIMADALLRNEKTNRPNFLGAIYDIMEESEKKNPTRGIDTIQFESTIKQGKQGAIDINLFNEDVENGQEAAKIYLENLIYKKDSEGNLTNEYDSDNYVTETSYDNFCIQQEIPSHFKDHSLSFGSLIRMTTPADLDLYVDPAANHDDPNNRVYYEWDEPDGTHKRVTAEEYQKEYEETISQNIEDSLDDLSKELKLNEENPIKRNIALSHILQREIITSPRYDIDLLQACSVDKTTGKFRIPKGDPILSKRIELLINSIIKNRVNKLEIAGGPVVLVTNYGASQLLHIRFYDKSGNILMTEEEYNKSLTTPTNQNNISAIDKFNSKYRRAKAPAVPKISYSQYLKENQAGVAYYEVLAPVWSNSIFELFMDADGSIDIKAIEALDPKLLDMIGYRIPTEAKYSCAKLKIVGFLPAIAGDAIMFPYELTEINDSDFDIDKAYIMRRDIAIEKKPDKEIRKAIFERVKDSVPENKHSKLKELIYSFVKNPNEQKGLSKSHQTIWNIYKEVAYNAVRPTKGKAYRDNKILDMTDAVFTHLTLADQMLSPGGFDPVKKIAYQIAASQNTEHANFDALSSMSIDELKLLYYTQKDLTFFDTHTLFYAQNSAAASLIGVAAVTKIAHAILEHDRLYIAVNELCGNHSFTIAGKTFGSRMLLDPMYSDEGLLISKILGSLVSASADAVKDPVFNLININMQTINVFTTMLRLGMNFEDATLFIASDIIKLLITEFNRTNLTGYTSLDKLINTKIKNYRKKHQINEFSSINTEELTREELIKGLRPLEENSKIEYKILMAFQKLQTLANTIRKPTFVTRFNSTSSAVGPQIIDNLILQKKLRDFDPLLGKDGSINSTNFYTEDGRVATAQTILLNHPILNSFSKTLPIASELFYDMPTGNVLFTYLLNDLQGNLYNTVFNDRNLLSKLGDFYTSYLLIASGFIKESPLKNYTEGFTTWFIKQNFKDKYPNNSFLKAILLKTTKLGKPYLEIKTTGLDNTLKRKLSDAWADLHKENSELSTQLFTYCFFRGGINFNPKTFMNLAPVALRLKLESNGISYKDVYRVFPTISESIVIDLFVRNNWNNEKLVPTVKKTSHFSYYNNGKLLSVRDSEDVLDLKNILYFKTTINNEIFIWKLLQSSEGELVYEKTTPLGGNNDYLEMSTSDIKKPLHSNVSIEDIEDEDSSLLEQTPTEFDSAKETSSPISEAELLMNINELIDVLMQAWNKNKATVTYLVLSTPKDKFLKDVLPSIKQTIKDLGLNINVEEVIKQKRKFC